MMRTPSASDKPEPTPKMTGTDLGDWWESLTYHDRLKAYHSINAHESLVQALEFYANHDNWKEQETGIGMFPGEALDYGATARQALATLSERNVER